MLRKHNLLALIIILVTDCTFLHSQNPRMDGYKGIWFSAGLIQEYGYKFSGGVSTFSSRHRPIAIYAPEVRKTYFVYGGTTQPDERHLLIMVSYFDHRTHKVPKPVVVYNKMGVREPYDNASISIDKQGYLWIFVSGNRRTRPGLIFKGSKPFSIDNFELMTKMEMVSPQPWWSDDTGFLLLYSRVSKGLDICFSSSTDGNSWIDIQKLITIGGSLQVSNLIENKLVTVFNYHPGGNIDKQTNLYLLQTEDRGKTWKTIDNRIIETPLSEINNPAIIKNYEAEGKLVHLSDLRFDKYGNPVILVILSGDYIPGPSSGAREWIIINWKDQKWNFHKVCQSTHNFDRGSLYIEDNTWKIIGPTEPGPQKHGTGGEVALWISTDEGTTWVKKLDITSNSTNNNSFVRQPLNPHKDFYALWTDGNADELSKSYLFFTSEQCNKVWILPYEMKKEFERPIRVR